MIVVVAGVAGSGKTTVGEVVADRLNCVFADGDGFHPAANVAKMHAGIALTDDDRWPWLRAIASWIDERSHDVAAARLEARHGHFFSRDLLDSQFATLELPRPPEPVDLVQATGTPDQIADQIIDLLSPA